MKAAYRLKRVLLNAVLNVKPNDILVYSAIVTMCACAQNIIVDLRKNIIGPCRLEWQSPLRTVQVRRSVICVIYPPGEGRYSYSNVFVSENRMTFNQFDIFVITACMCHRLYRT